MITVQRGKVGAATGPALISRIWTSFPNHARRPALNVLPRFIFFFFPHELFLSIFFRSIFLYQSLDRETPLVCLSLSFRVLLHLIMLSQLLIAAFGVTAALGQTSYGEQFKYWGCATVDAAGFSNPVPLPNGILTPEACQGACAGHMFAAVSPE